MNLQLVSFKLCPFDQRSVIVAREKTIALDITYIDLAEPPPWFSAISPLRKVPLLRVGNEVVFESAAIMEYLDEVTPPSLHPQEPLRKAHNRAWIEFASTLFFTLYRLTLAQEENEFAKNVESLRADLVRLEGEVQGPYFNGAEFRLVDAAFAPFFMRHHLLDSWNPMGVLQDLQRLQAWEDSLLSRRSVQTSVVEDFATLLQAHIAHGGGYAATRFAQA